MDLTQFLAVFGSISGALSLVGIVLAIGMYKERIDRHERWFNLLVEESLMRAWKRGVVERSSPFKPKREVVEALPSAVRRVCQRVAAACGPGCPSWKVADRLMAALEKGIVDQFCLANGLTPLEAMGTLTVYTMDLMTRQGPSPVK